MTASKSDYLTRAARPDDCFRGLPDKALDQLVKIARAHQVADVRIVGSCVRVALHGTYHDSPCSIFEHVRTVDELRQILGY